MDARVDGLYKVLKGRIDFANIVPTCIEIAGEIEDLGGLKGGEKLDLLQKVLRQALKESSMSAEDKEKSLFTIDTVVPIAVQAAILASKSPIVAHVQTAVVSCCLPPRVKRCACKKGACTCRSPVSSLPPNFVE
jgi:hypothetical protein